MRIAIIGGGAAGMMCACALQEHGKDGTASVGAAHAGAAHAGAAHAGAAHAGAASEVLLFEKNGHLGAKVLISGGGRCNVTTGIFDVKKLLENYPRGAKFLMSAMFRFSPEKVMEWFENRGVKMKIEDDLRVFPLSNEGREVVAALEKGMKIARASGSSWDQHYGTKVFLNSNVVEIKKVEVGDTAGHFLVTLKNGKTFDVDKVIITSGGNAYRHTGSTGDGYAFAKSLGHTITEMAPSLSSFVLAEKFVGKAAGIAFAKVSMTLKSFNGERVFKRVGPFLFTHSGITGPAIFALSSMSAYEKCDVQSPMSLSINFFPDEKPVDLEKRIVKLIDEHGKKRLINLLDLILPKSLCQVFLEYVNAAGSATADVRGAGIFADLIAAKINRDQRKLILNALQNFNLHVVGRGAGDEFVTAGGVDLKEVNPNTMESKICPGLYFAGEILDVDGYTGGFNLQAAWATGRLAGESL